MMVKTPSPAAKPMVTFSAAQHHRLAGIKSYCILRDNDTRINNLPKVITRQRVEPKPLNREQKYLYNAVFRVNW